ncbi:MAG: ATPase, partial [Eubacteriales bacterium]|nr:ATPase [Eubacteriales bacterium]MDD3073535.1 ATPase [Eubacteriales bacterium]
MKDIHLFAGANSAQGFCSHYQYLAMDSFKRVFILKGGPGTGKSTIIKEVARQIHFPQEKYHCTADAKSLDGLYIPALQVSILDGTAPHTTDPRLPGAVQQTVDLGSCWDYKALAARRQQIQELATEISELYQIAYRWLAVAASLADLVQELERHRDVEVQTQDCLAKILPFIPDREQGFKRKAFASGLTSKGIV